MGPASPRTACLCVIEREMLSGLCVEKRVGMWNWTTRREPESQLWLALLTRLQGEPEVKLELPEAVPKHKWGDGPNSERQNGVPVQRYHRQQCVS